MILGALMVWGPLDSIPGWVGFAALTVGGLMVAVAMGIRMLRS